MNIFSGARRIAVVLAILAAVVTISVAWMEKPDVVLKYRVPTYGGPILASDTCDYSTDAIESLEFETKAGHPFKARICFAANRASDGRMLVPYKEENDYVLMNSPYSEEVKAYIGIFITHIFKVSSEDYIKAEEEYQSQYWFKKGQAFGGLLAGLAMFWLAVWTLGWIVRGFLGIPRGQDSRRVSPKEVEAA